MEEYVMESVVRGHHVYKSVWHPVLREQLTLERDNSKSHDRHAVSVMKDGTIVGHVPRELLSVYYHFIRPRSTCVRYAHARNKCGENPLKTMC